jgi:hypothetical protein
MESDFFIPHERVILILTSYIVTKIVAKFEADIKKIIIIFHILGTGHDKYLKINKITLKKDTILSLECLFKGENRHFKKLFLSSNLVYCLLRVICFSFLERRFYPKKVDFKIYLGT